MVPCFSNSIHGPCALHFGHKWKWKKRKLQYGLQTTIMDKFLWDTCVYFSPMHILRTSDASPHSMLGINWSTFSPAHYFPPSNIEWGGRGLQKHPENVITSDLKDKTLYCPNEFVWICQTDRAADDQTSHPSEKGHFDHKCSLFSRTNVFHLWTGSSDQPVLANG